MKTKLINYRTYNLDKSKVIPIDRRSIFGNPFPLTKYSRDESILQYSVWFYRQLEFRPEFVKAVKKLKGHIVGCWCRPDEGFKGRLLCHGQIIIAYLEGCKPEDVE